MGKKSKISHRDLIQMSRYGETWQAREIAKRDKRIKELETQLENRGIDLKQQTDNFSASQRDLEKATKKIDHLKRFLVVMLVPWADRIGSRKLMFFTNGLFLALGFSITNEAIEVRQEVLADLYKEMSRLLANEVPLDSNTPDSKLPPIGKCGDVFYKWVYETFGKKKLAEP